MMIDDVTHNRPNPGGRGGSAAGGHLSAETITAYLDQELSPSERAAAESHLQGCADCRRDLAGVRATVTLLQGLPVHRPGRSFQLGPEHARTARGSWLARLMPSLPALRTATAVVAMLLLVVIAGDVLTNQGDDADQSGDSAPASESEMREAAPAGAAAIATSTPAPLPVTREAPAVPPQPTPTETRRLDSAVPAAQPADDVAAFTESDEEAEADEEPLPAQDARANEGDGVAADAAVPPDIGESSPTEPAAGGAGAAESAGESMTGGVAQAEPSGATPAATPTSSPTATPSPTATASPTPSPSPSPTATVSPTPAPTPTPAVEPASDGGDRPSLWRIAEIGLGLLLAWLIVSIIGSRRLRRS